MAAGPPLVSQDRRPQTRSTYSCLESCVELRCDALASRCAPRPARPQHSSMAPRAPVRRPTTDATDRAQISAREAIVRGMQGSGRLRAAFGRMPLTTSRVVQRGRVAISPRSSAPPRERKSGRKASTCTTSAEFWPSYLDGETVRRNAGRIPLSPMLTCYPYMVRFRSLVPPILG